MNAFKQIAKLCRRDRHRAIRLRPRSRHWPDEASALQPLGIKAQALAVVPEHLIREGVLHGGEIDGSVGKRLFVIRRK